MQIRASNKPCGVVHFESGNQAYLPLEYVEVHADIIDVSALVTISQHFWQYSPSGLTRAKYVFPVPARAAVCGFDMMAEDGTVITAVVKEREEAKREHQEAIRQGFMTGLVEHVTDDVFSISLGALPGQQMITTRVTYVLDLMDDDVSDQIRLQLPMYIGSRYGTVPIGMAGARRVTSDRIHISVDVRMQGAVKNIASPTHPSVITTPNGLPQHPQLARYTSGDFMTQDFVLVVTAEGLDAPRCFAQRAPNGTVAMQLSIVPKFNLPSVPQQEYIFVVDRSGSMNGQRIETAKRALVMLLRALPSQGSWFNIFSFGTRSNSLWTQSVMYDERSMAQATYHVDTMTANYGGTEIRSVLANVFRSRNTSIPSAVFVLTDGEAHNVDHTIVPIEQAVKQATSNAHVRVFTLGIGETTSSAMCEGMARAGNGLCLMATAAETIIGKCSRLVRASRTYILKNVSVDWGVRTDLTEAYRTGSTELKGVRQAPAEIAAMYPGNRFIVFALVEDATFVPPRDIIIRAQRDGHGEVLQFSVPVQIVEFPPEHHPQPLIQTLATRRAIMDVEDGSRTVVASDAKSLIVRLGTQYQLASRYTSFIAVDKRTRTEVNRGLDEDGYSRPAPTVPTPANGPQLIGMRYPSPSSFPQATGAAMFGQPAAGSQFPQTMAFGQQIQMRHRSRGRGGGMSGASAYPQPLGGGMSDASAHSQLFGGGMSDASAHSEVRSGSRFGASAFSGREREREHVAVVSFDDKAPVSVQSTEDRVFQLIRLQAFDGSFAPSMSLLALLGKAISFGQAQTLRVPEKVLATALAVAWLKEHMKDQPELLDSIVDKAVEFISQTPGADPNTLLAQAQNILSSS